MKCFEATNGSVKEGIPLTWTDEPFAGYLASVGSTWIAKALLSGVIVERSTGGTCGGMFELPGRLARANLDVRSQLWLSPESLDTSEDALVLVHSWFWKKLKAGGQMTISTHDAEILHEVKHEVADGKEALYTYVVGWVRVSPGGWVRVDFEEKKSKPIARIVGKTHSLYRETYSFKFDDGRLNYEEEFLESKLV